MILAVAVILVIAIFMHSQDGAVIVSSFLYQVPANIIKAVIKVESDGNANAVGGVGERGLMQLTEKGLADSNTVTGFKFSFDEMFTPWKNIVAGTGFLRYARNRVSDWETAIRAYNVGVTNALTSPAGFTYLEKVKKYL